MMGGSIPVGTVIGRRRGSWRVDRSSGIDEVTRRLLPVPDLAETGSLRSAFGRLAERLAQRAAGAGGATLVAGRDRGHASRDEREASVCPEPGRAHESTRVGMRWRTQHLLLGPQLP